MYEYLIINFIFFYFRVNTEQIDSLLKHLPSGIPTIAPSDHSFNSKMKRNDDEKIMDKIHGTTVEEKSPPRRSRLPPGHPKIPIITPPSSSSGLENFGSQQNFRSFGQSIVSQTIRKPDGSYETRRILRDSDGNTKTTVTRTIDGKTETITTYDNSVGNSTTPAYIKPNDTEKSLLKHDQNMKINQDGYTLPKNLW